MILGNFNGSSVYISLHSVFDFGSNLPTIRACSTLKSQQTQPFATVLVASIQNQSLAPSQCNGDQSYEQARDTCDGDRGRYISPDR